VSSLVVTVDMPETAVDVANPVWISVTADVAKALASMALAAKSTAVMTPG
jgi:hypothetical protein